MQIRNWARFQHYKQRNPPWIKLHNLLLDDYHWVVWTPDCKLLAVASMLLAARTGNRIPWDQRYIESVAHIPAAAEAMEELERSEWVTEVLADASNLRQNWPSEGEGEGEGETESVGADAPRTRAGCGARLPDDFTLTTERRLVAEGERLPAERTFAKFCDYWRSASGSRAKKLDWDATWRNWCRTEADRALAGSSRGGAVPLQPKPAPSEAEISEARRKAAADNVRTAQRLGLAACKAMP